MVRLAVRDDDADVGHAGPVAIVAVEHSVLHVAQGVACGPQQSMNYSPDGQETEDKSNIPVLAFVISDDVLLAVFSVCLWDGMGTPI